ncbi:Receptor-like protein kinase [Quillaja saponaria]|uniref:non-specific serine/threonine protein kinase n=1 Tax=Quillaja saponaria TaxID=32244 RepID=A0AAD7PLA1_QUISA|nr:Receptor-like protein kinase [Quillaja saponaria]
MSKVGALSSSTDGQVLLSFKSMVSDPHNALSGWNLSSSHCSWSGVSCTKNGKRVFSLRLPSRGLAGLKVLDLSVNGITGAIPSTFGNLSTLTNLSIARNKLRGMIPIQLGQLQNLRTLQLSENELSGMIPFSIYNMSSLEFLSLTKNSLVGNLNTNIGVAFPNLKGLFLSHNKLEGPIPNSVSNASQLQILDLSSNMFSGVIPVLGNLNNIRTLHFGQNHLSSTTEQNYKVFGSLTNCTQLKNLYMNSNKLAGQLPSSVANLSASLQEFCVDDNLLNGDFPLGFESLHNLTSLAIHQNFFTGQIPIAIGKLQQLQKFTIFENMLSGEIPDIFGNLTRLYFLLMGNNQLTGRIPTSLAKCQQLTILGLEGNRLDGTITRQIFVLPSLNTLLLARNSLSGSLPREVGSLKQLENIDVSDNQLSGNIPAEIGHCSSLQSLGMARNKLTGLIPDTLGELKALTRLDLSSNNFSGLIPDDLEDLSALQILNLSFNTLEGQVPSKNIFANLSWNSVQGNYKLCATEQEIAGKLRVSTCPREDKSTMPWVVKIVILISVFIVLVSAIVCSIWVWMMQKKKKSSHGVNGSHPHMVFQPSFSYSEIRAATNGFVTENLIGKGGFGSVYKAVFTSENGLNTTLAVKVLDLKQSKASKSFDVECQAFRNVRHRNLIKIVSSCSGIDHTGAEFKALIMEYMVNGNLDEWLYPNDIESKPILSLTQRLNISIDVASALDYLHHDCDQPVVHCDLKPGNVLIDENMVGNVGDYGLSKILFQNSSQEESSTMHLKGSIGYIPPEYGLGGKASTSGDVYSFGILLLEMFMAKKPTEDVFQEGLNLEKFASAVHENQVLSIADPRLFIDTECQTQGSVTSHSGGSDSSNRTFSHTDVNYNWLENNEAAVEAAIRVGLSCSVYSAKDRISMREALTKLMEIKKYLRN